MPTDEEQRFMDNPKTFMEANVVRVVCGEDEPGIYRFRLVRREITARETNRRGGALPYYELRADDAGDVPMYFLPYLENSFRQATLPAAGDVDLMTTVQLNGCSFGHAQGNNNAGAYVTHHNDIEHGNAAQNIEQQAVNNPFGDDDGGAMRYFHQAAYRKLSGHAVDTRYFATIVGKRQEGGRWLFYCQRKKDLQTVFDRAYWTLKGVVDVNP